MSKKLDKIKSDIDKFMTGKNTDITSIKTSTRYLSDPEYLNILDYLDNLTVDEKLKRTVQGAVYENIHNSDSINYHYSYTRGCLGVKDISACKNLKSVFKVLGKGYFGSVSKVLADNVPIAIKRATFSSTVNDIAIGIFIRYKYIIKVDDFLNSSVCNFINPGLQAVIMDITDGDLTSMLKKGLDANKLTDIICACYILRVNDILYTDMKSDNILVKCPDGFPSGQYHFVLGDLGGCSFMNRSIYCARGLITPLYLPEYNEKTFKDLTTFSTLYGIALIACEILTGKSLFDFPERESILAQESLFLLAQNTTAILDPIIVKLIIDCYTNRLSPVQDILYVNFSDYMRSGSDLKFSYTYNFRCGSKISSITKYIKVLHRLLENESIVLAFAVFHSVHYLNHKTFLDTEDIKILFNLTKTTLSNAGFNGMYDKRSEEIFTHLNGCVRSYNLSDRCQNLEDFERECLHFLTDEYLDYFESIVRRDGVLPITPCGLTTLSEIPNFSYMFKKLADDAFGF